MDKKILKWTGMVFGIIVVLILCAYTFVYFNIESRADKIYEVNLQKLVVPSDRFSIKKGEHIAQNRGCMGCHGKDLAGGRAFADDQSPIGILYTSNLTSGKGGIQFTDDDWVKALRHGLGKDNRSLWFMPANEIYHISNQDMGYLISFVKSRPPVDKIIPSKSLKPFGRLLTFLGKFPLFPAEKINHSATFAEVVTPGINPEYGKYLAITCTGCHGSNFKGGPSHEPGGVAIPDISATGHLGKWNSENFTTAIRTGKTPEGKILSAAMPWKEFTFTEQELQAMHSYLHGLN